MQTTSLTDRQERFVHEYMIDQNATQAAIRCGYSPRSARTQAAELMKLPGVKQRIRDGLAKLFAELDITAARLLRERAKIAFFNPASLFDGQGQPIPLQFLDADTMAALNVSYEMRIGEVWAIRVRPPNRAPHMAALEKMLAKFKALEQEVEEEEREEQRRPRMTPEIFDRIVAEERREREAAREAARAAAEARAAARAPANQPPAGTTAAPGAARQPAKPEASGAVRQAPEPAKEPINPARLGFRSFDNRPKLAEGAGEVWID